MTADVKEAGGCSARSSPPATEGPPARTRARDQEGLGARRLRPWTCDAREIWI
jgi:hypothetical protein